jgi:molybdopterin synthase catalytic subunit
MKIVTGLEAAPLNTEAIVDAITTDASGALVVFEGRTRSPNEGRIVERLTYEAFEERVTKQLDAFARDVGARNGIHGVAAVHRTGDVATGEPSVVVAVAAEHRDVAFAAARELIDRIKSDAAIWKKEIFADGEAWSGLPA